MHSDVMPSSQKRREDVTKNIEVLQNISILNRKKRLQMKIEHLLRNKFSKNIETIFSLSLLKKIKTLLTMLMFNDHIDQFFKDIQNKLNVINKNINHTTETIKFYAATTKKKHASN